MAKRKQPSLAAFGFTSKEAKESNIYNVNGTTFNWPGKSSGPSKENNQEQKCGEKEKSEV